MDAQKQSMPSDCRGFNDNDDENGDGNENDDGADIDDEELWEIHLINRRVSQVPLY